MDKPFDFKAAVEFALARNEELVARYKDSLHSVRLPSVNKVVHSVIDQKTKHTDLLKEIAASASAHTADPVGLAQSLIGPVPPPDESGDPAVGLLNLIVAEETRLAALYACLRDAAKDGDIHDRFRTLSEASLKFSGWTKDHIELLELF